MKLTHDQINQVIDEFNLIREKKSNLPKKKRDKIVALTMKLKEQKLISQEQ